MTPSKRKQSVSEFFTNNWGLKLASLATAILLFSLVRGAEDAQRSVFVEVTARIPPSSSGKMLISDVPDQVRLTLQGSRSQVNDIRDLRVEIDLTDTSQRYYYFADDDFDVPAGVTIAQVAPVSIPLSWADRVEKRLRIQPRLIGALAEGLAMEAPPRVTPPEVVVIGPGDELDTVRVVHTTDIDRSSLSVGPNNRNVPLIVPSSHSRFADEAPARVSIDVVRDLTDRILPGIAVAVEGAEGGTLEPAVVTVTVQGAPSVIDLIDPAAVQATGSLPSAEQLQEGPVPLRVELQGLPTGADVLTIEPSQVVYTAPQ